MNLKQHQAAMRGYVGTLFPEWYPGCSTRWYIEQFQLLNRHGIHHHPLTFVHADRPAPYIRKVER
jgi:hypothetical protein